MSNSRLWTSLCLLVLLLALPLAGCKVRYPESCPASTPIGVIDAGAIADDDGLPFRFPLDEPIIDGSNFYTRFGISNECPPGASNCFRFSERQYHAAEDYQRPAGTPVYAIADGRISFSGTAGGYGWLVIIDHPQANLYSLYGHLSPSRWRMKAGAEVSKGDLIAYLGDSDENGGSAESPLEPHLHFGVRLGQTGDYPYRGEWRFMAGWIRYCPQDLGWVQPSLIITNQEIPLGGYPAPAPGFLVRWGLESLFTGIYLICGIAMLVSAVRKKLHWLLILPGIVTIAAWFVFYNNRMLSTPALLVVGMLILAVGVYHLVALVRK